MPPSPFNPDQFMQASYSQPTDTRLVPVPEGDYTAQIVKLVPRTFDTKDGSTATVLDISWEVLDETARKATGLDKPQVRQTVFLDIAPSGAIDMGKGKSVQLGRVREAAGQNSTKSWSVSQLNGAMAKIRVVLRPDKDDPEIKYSDVKAVTSL